MNSNPQAIAFNPLSRSGTEVHPLASLLLPSFGVAVFAVTLLQVLFLSQGPAGLLRDSDTGWHIRNGEAILDSSVLPVADTFSYTRPGQPWFAWEWLSDVGLAMAHRWAGLPGVALLAALVIASCIWGAARLSVSLGGNILLTAGATALLLGVTSIHWLARPHVFSWGMALLVLAIVEHRRGLFWLPIVACLWANLHGSFLLGPSIVLIYAAGETIRRRPSGPLWIAGTASMLATFVNPYGWRLHRHVLSYLQNDYLMDHVSEFRSFSFHSSGAYYVEAFLLMAVLGAVILFKQRAFGPGLLCLALLHISLYSARHLASSAVLLLPLCVAALSREAWQLRQLRRVLEYSERLLNIDRRIWGIVPLAAVLALAVGLAGRPLNFSPGKFPVRAADFLQQRKTGERVFAKDQWGGYLIYRFAGRVKVFVDGRSDFYGRDFLEEYALVNEAKPHWNDVLKRYGVRFALVAPDTALSTVLMASPHWKQVYADSVAMVFEAADDPVSGEKS